MNILLLLIPLSLLLLLSAVAAFVWAVRRGQFEDLDTPAIDILSEDAPVRGEDADASQDTPPPPATHHPDDAGAPERRGHAD